MTTKSTFNPVVLKRKGFTTFVLILLATLALMAVVVYSQITTGKTVTEGFVAGETFVTNEKMMFGSRGGVGPAWHHGPKTFIANPQLQK